VETQSISAILGDAARHLREAGYRRVPAADELPWPTTFAHTYEDVHAVVALAVFESWSALEEGWPVAQGCLVDLMSRFLSRDDPKAWDGYLVLITPDTLPHGQEAACSEIRQDLSRVRKLVATQDLLGARGGVAAVLQPLLRLQADAGTEGRKEVLDRLPELLAPVEGLSPEHVRVAVRAFRDGVNPVKALWELDSGGGCDEA
jgi:hypothetical protein